MSGTSDALRVIELTSARLRKDIGGLPEPSGNAPKAEDADRAAVPRIRSTGGKAPLIPMAVEAAASGVGPGKPADVVRHDAIARRGLPAACDGRLERL